MGWLGKGSVIALSLAGTALLVFLVVQVAKGPQPPAVEPQPAPPALAQGNQPHTERKEASRTPDIHALLEAKAAEGASPKPRPANQNLPQPLPPPPPGYTLDRPAAAPVDPAPITPTRPASPLAASPHLLVLSPEDLFTKASPAVVRVQVRDRDFKLIGQGSGFFVSADGFLVTNYHVVEGAHFATVRLANDSALSVEGVAAVDPRSDLAVLKVKGADLPFLSVADGPPPKVGSKVYAIGNPQGLTNTLSDGLVSGVRKLSDGPPIIQTTAPISRGSSGGPLLSGDGQVVGVTTAYLASGQNLNLAVPADQVLKLLQSRGPLKTLASAGGKRQDKEAADELDKAWEAMSNKDWKMATELLANLRRREADNPYVWNALGYLHSSLKNHDIALQHYKVAVSLKPDFAEVYCRMGYEFSDLGQHGDMADSFKKYLALSAGDIEGYVKLAYYCRVRGVSHAEALDVHRAACEKAIATKPVTVDEFCWVAKAHLQFDEYWKAITVCKRAGELDPGAAEPYLLIAGIYAKQLKKPEEALRTCRDAIARVRESEKVFGKLGELLQKMGRLAESVEAYQESLRIKWDVGAACGLAESYREMKRYDDAIRTFDDLLRKKPSGIWYSNLGEVCVEAKQYAQAVQAYKMAISLYGEENAFLRAIAYLGLGDAHKGLRQYTDAIHAYKKGIQGGCTGPKSYFDLAEAYRESGVAAEAVVAYRKAIDAADGQGEIAERALARLVKLESETREKPSP